MGVYHLAGLGRSIGAVTAAFSYLAARKALPDSDTDPLFTLSGEADEDPAPRNGSGIADWRSSSRRHRSCHGHQ